MFANNIIIVYKNTNQYLRTVNVLRRKIVGPKFREPRAQVTSTSIQGVYDQMPC